MYLPGLSHSGSGSQVVPKGADWLGLHFAPFQVRVAQVFGERGCCNLLPLLFLQLSFLQVPLAYFLRWMMTVQNPKKS